MKYLIITYIIHAKHFVKYFINKVLHFDIMTTSRDKNEHAILKRHLKLSTENLKTMMNEISMLLMNKYHNHTLQLTNDKIRYLMKFRKSIFKIIFSYIIISIIKQIYSQYELVIERLTTISICKSVFIIIINLSCSHKIQEKLFDEEHLLIKNTHSL